MGDWIAMLGTPAAICSVSALLAASTLLGAALDRAFLRLRDESRPHRRRARALAACPLAPPGRATGDDWVAESPPHRPALLASGVRAAPAMVRDHGPAESRSPAPGLGGSQPVQSPVASAFSVGPAAVAAPPLPRVPGFDALPCGPSIARSARPPEAGHLEMRPLDHVTEFLAYVRDRDLGQHPKTRRWECRRDSASWIAAYHAWARPRAIKVIPEWQFLALMAEQAGVEKSRDRLKDSCGRVIKTGAGSPVRAYFYTVADVAPVAALPKRRAA